MKKAKVLVNGVLAGFLEALDAEHYRFIYENNYLGPPVSLTMPITQLIYDFDKFPSFFEGLLPEGVLLDALLRKYKLDRNDFFGQLIRVGHDVVGAVTIEVDE